MNSLASIAVGIPLLGAGAIGVASAGLFDLRTKKDTAAQTRAVTFRRIALTASIVTFVSVLGATLADWFLDRHHSAGANGLGESFALLTAAVWLPTVFVGRQCESKRPALLYGLLLLLEAAFMGIFAAEDAVLFCVFMEASTVLLYLLLSGWGGAESERIARKFLVFNLVADLLVLIAVLGAVVAAGRMPEDSLTESSHELSYSISALTQEIPRLASDDIGGQDYWKHARRWLLTALILGLAIKMPLLPFHTWFTPVIAEGPLCVGLGMLGSGLHVGLYAFVRIAWPLCGELGGWSDLLVGLTVLAACHQGLLALAHGDLKKMAACIGLSQLSLAAAACFSQMPTGASAAVLLAIAAGLASTLLLFSFVFLEMRFGARDLSLFGGIWQRLPQISCVLILAVLALVGVPGLCGFTGLWPTLGALFEFGWLSGILAPIAGLIVGWALFWMLEQLVFGPLRSPGSVGSAESSSVEVTLAADGSQIVEVNSAGDSAVPADSFRLDDLRLAEVLIVAPLIAGIVLMGLRPQLIVDWVNASLQMTSFSP